MASSQIDSSGDSLNQKIYEESQLCGTDSSSGEESQLFGPGSTSEHRNIESPIVVEESQLCCAGSSSDDLNIFSQVVEESQLFGAGSSSEHINIESPMVVEESQLCCAGSSSGVLPALEQSQVVLPVLAQIYEEMQLSELFGPGLSDLSRSVGSSSALRENSAEEQKESDDVVALSSQESCMSTVLDLSDDDDEIKSDLLKAFCGPDAGPEDSDAASSGMNAVSLDSGVAASVTPKQNKKRSADEVQGSASTIGLDQDQQHLETSRKRKPITHPSLVRAGHRDRCRNLRTICFHMDFGKKDLERDF